MEECKFLKQFNFCPKCGGEFKDNNFKSRKCTKCGFIYYFNPSSAVVAIIKNSKGELLVARRAKEPAKGTLDLMGGFVDSYETAEMAIIREIKEESGLDVISLKYLFSLPNLYNYSNFEVHTLDMFFECRVENFEGIKAQDDVAELKFINPKDIKPSQFGLKSISEGIRVYLENKTELF